MMLFFSVIVCFCAFVFHSAHTGTTLSWLVNKQRKVVAQLWSKSDAIWKSKAHSPAALYANRCG